MLSSISAFLATLILLTPLALGVHLHGRDINEPLLPSYDYIVVGCGISGLVVTNRLSEIPSRTVLCIEAGVPDHYEQGIQDPAYVGSDVGSGYDWGLATVPQTQLDGNPRAMPQGKVFGGGSILNAMCWNRGGTDDYDAWEALGNPGWGWAGLLPYFKKSETYTPVYSEQVAQEYSINYNPAVHGTSGPVQVSYPKYFYPQSVNLFAAMNDLGLTTQFDPNDGTSAGPALIPTDIDPNNQTRSDARRTYFDPYVTRSNFHVITGQHVTRVLIDGVANNSQVSNPSPGGNDNGNGPASGNSNGFGFGPAGSTPPLAGHPPGIAKRQNPASSNLRITGVEFALNGSSIRHTIHATREVIIAAGALHTPQLLQLSGIGPTSLLNQYNIPQALDLPGVGNNLQDHCLVGTYYPYNNASYPSPTELTTNVTYNTEAQQEYDTSKTGPYTAGSPNAMSFNPLPLISSNSYIILDNATGQGTSDYLPPGLDPTIVAGFALQKRSLASRLARTNVAAYEIINNNAGSLTVAVMHPFSRGTCYITSADPFQPPAIDPRWLSNPVDRQILVEALRFNQQILNTVPMQELQPAQFVPPPNADETALSQIIDNGIQTEFHPSGTAAMLPLEQGGVVDSHLLVYGTQNLRVVDASIFPLVPAAHLQAVVYGVAEKAADIIKAGNLKANIQAKVNVSYSAQSAASSGFSIARYSASLARNSSSSSLSAASSRPSMNFGASRSPSLRATSTPVASSASMSALPSVLATSSSPMETSVTAANPAGDALIVSSSSTSSQSILIFTTTLPSDLPAQLASITLSKPQMSTTSQEAVTTSGPDEIPSGPAQVSASVLNILTAAGVPKSVAPSLASVIIGSPPASGPASTGEAEIKQQERLAAIDAVLQWLFSYFHLNQ